ncbi:MAG: energy-coupling factor transporter transmembrane protein EcfT [Spirochaetaceae bacterium]|nr:energy-coupling factor transporter transmembrane protein EcfT [Spirochaetaceae bacterium]
MSQFHRAAAGIDHLERLSRASSPVHRLNTGVKFAVCAFFIVLVISFPQQNISALFPFFLYPAVMMSLSGTPYRPLLARLVYALPFALFAGISNIIFMKGTAFTLGIFSVSTGVVSCCAILLKTILTVFSVLILVASTPFTEISALLTANPLFRVFGLQILLCYRYIFVLLDESQSMWTAYILRSAGEKALKMRDMGSFLGQLLLRSMSKAERVYYAMKCRGFNGVYHTQKESQKLKLADIVFLLVVPAVLVFLRFFNGSLFIGRIIGIKG